MSALTKRKKKYTPEEYLALEDKAELRSEYWDGYIIPLQGESPELAGATENHNLIVTNLVAEFKRHLRERKCRIYSTDMKVWVESSNKFFYPDLAIVCGKRKFYQDRRNIIENPEMIIEVLSKSTGIKDRTKKLWAYQTLESLQEYILVSQDEYVVEKYERQTDDSWKYLATIGADSSVTFSSVAVTLSFNEIYDLVEFETEV